MIKLKFALWRLNNKQTKMLMCNLKMAMLNSLKIPFWDNNKIKGNNLNHSSNQELTGWLLRNSLRGYLTVTFSWTTLRTSVGCTVLLSEIWTRSLLQMCCVEGNSCWSKVKLRESHMHPTLRNSPYRTFETISEELLTPLKWWNTSPTIVIRRFPVSNILWTWLTLWIQDLW